MIYPSVLWGQNHGSLYISECTCGIAVQRCWTQSFWSALSGGCLPFSVLSFHLQNLFATHFALTQPIKIWSRTRSCSYPCFSGNFISFLFRFHFIFFILFLFPHISHIKTVFLHLPTFTWITFKMHSRIKLSQAHENLIWSKANHFNTFFIFIYSIKFKMIYLFVCLFKTVCRACLMSTTECY